MTQTLPSFPLTSEGEAIIALAKQSATNVQIDALAGTGKTYILYELQRVLPEPVLCLAFNVGAVNEMINGTDTRPPFKDTSVVRGFNSLGHRVWGEACGYRLVLNKSKSRDLYRVIVNDYKKKQKEEAYEILYDVCAAVSLAKNLGYIPAGKYPNAKPLCTLEQLLPRLDAEPTALFLKLLDEVLLASIKAAYAGQIDFDDQIYMSALFGGTFPKYPNLLVDEDQDLCPCNVEMLSHFKNSRLFAVGDPWQSIYAFRGAMQDGMSLQKQRFAMESLPLSVSFRCPQAIVELARWRAPNFQWHKPGGRVGTLRNPTLSSLPDNATVVCRNNAPIFSLAIRLLSAGRSVTVRGSDIGPKLIALMQKLGPEEMNQEMTLGAIEDWLTEKLSKESKTAPDLAACMRVFANIGDSLAQAIAYAKDVLAQEGTITLLTGHKAKGLEFPLVYHLDPWLLDSSDQDLNLRYVIQTRSADTYFEINTEEIR